MLLEEGQALGTAYVVERFLGEGAFGEVYRVRHRFLGRQAMKVFKAVGMTPAETEQWLGEAILLSRLGHPNIVRVFDADVIETPRGSLGYFTMEYVGGGTLERFWQAHQDSFVPLATTVDIVQQVCRGLGVAHREQPPIVHRDIKPTNILVGYDIDGLRIRVSDFGLAKHANPLTLLLSARGTIAFKAPEVFADPQSDSCAGDVWSVGVTLYLLLTDRWPFPIPALPEIGPRVFDVPLAPPSRHNPAVDADLDAIVCRALARAPQQRFADANALGRALGHWRASRPAAAQAHKPDTDGRSDLYKRALGPHTPPDEPTARRLVEQAEGLAKQSGRLGEAADLLERAINAWPQLRSEYEYVLRLWRRGLVQ